MKNFNQEYYFNYTLFETENFRVIPSLGSLVAGWLLIIPKEHYISIGAIDNLELHAELNCLTNHVLNIVKAEYGKAVVFEHGAVEKNKFVGCGVDYAHLHIVPTQIDLVSGVEKHSDINLEWKNISDLSSAKKYIENGLPYLFVQDQQNKLLISTHNNIPSQLFRKILASELGIAEKYNWKENYFEENIKKTISTFSKYSKEVKLEELQSI